MCHSRQYSVRMTCPKRPSFQSEPWKEMIKLHLYSALVCYFFVLNNLQLVSILFPASRGLSRQGIYFIEIVVNWAQGHGYECWGGGLTVVKCPGISTHQYIYLLIKLVDRLISWSCCIDYIGIEIKSGEITHSDQKQYRKLPLISPSAYKPPQL